MSRNFTANYDRARRAFCRLAREQKFASIIVQIRLHSTKSFGRRYFCLFESLILVTRGEISLLSHFFVPPPPPPPQTNMAYKAIFFYRVLSKAVNYSVFGQLACFLFIFKTRKCEIVSFYFVFCFVSGRDTKISRN